MTKRRVRTVVLLGILLFAGFLFLVPVVLTVIGSFLLGDGLSLVGYRALFFDCFPFCRMFWNLVEQPLLFHEELGEGLKL